jgi:hypothetical protein
VWWLGIDVLLQNFVLLNVVLATVFSAYQSNFQKRTVERFRNRALGLYEAFDVLVDERDRLQRHQTAAGTTDVGQTATTDFGPSSPTPLRARHQTLHELALNADLRGVSRGQFKSLVAELNRSGSLTLIPDNQVT